jgi:hypothetical protein
VLYWYFVTVQHGTKAHDDRRFLQHLVTITVGLMALEEVIVN